MTNTLAILLETVVPSVTIINIVILTTLALFGFLFRDLYNRSNKRIEKLEDNYEELHTKIEKEVKSIETRINDLHINILNKLDEIKYKFNEFRK